MRTIAALLIAGTIAACATSPVYLGGCGLHRDYNGVWKAVRNTAECREAADRRNDMPPDDAATIIFKSIGVIGLTIGAAFLAAR